MVSRSFIVFSNLTVSKMSGQVFVPCHSIQVCLIFAPDQTEVVGFGDESHRSEVPFWFHHIRESMICFITGDINLGHLVNVVSARFLYNLVAPGGREFPARGKFASHATEGRQATVWVGY